MIPKKRFPPLAPPPKKNEGGIFFKYSNATHFVQTKTLLLAKKLQFWSFEQTTFQHNQIELPAAKMFHRWSNPSPPLMVLFPPFPSQGNEGGKLPYARTAPMQEEEENTFTAHNIVSSDLLLMEEYTCMHHTQGEWIYCALPCNKWLTDWLRHLTTTPKRSFDPTAAIGLAKAYNFLPKNRRRTLRVKFTLST